MSDVLLKLRTSSVDTFSTAIGKEGSLICVQDALSLFTPAYNSFKNALYNRNIFDSKILAYTNKRVEALNLKMRSLLFKDSEFYRNGEILTSYENFEFNWSSYWNSMDYVLVDDPIKDVIKIPYFTSMDGYRLNLYDVGNNSIDQVFIISPDTPEMYLTSLAALIEETRLQAVVAKERRQKNSGTLWQKYYEINGSFLTPVNLFFDNRLIKKKTFDYGYAVTIHKS